MGLLYKYTYLNANGYLDKFRNALKAPGLTRATLTKILKIYDRNHRFKDFIVDNGDGNKCLYHKGLLNDILGVDEIGMPTVNPNRNPKLAELERILTDIEIGEYEKSRPKVTAQAAQMDNNDDYYNPEEDMAWVSNELIKQGNLNEKKMNGKRIIISESQFSELKKRLAEAYFFEPEKVNIVAKFLDDNFVRAAFPTMGEDGYPKTIGIVGLKDSMGNVVKNMTAAQAFYMLQDKFNKIYSEPKQRDSFLKKILIDWYNKKISREGLPSSNSY